MNTKYLSAFDTAATPLLVDTEVDGYTHTLSFTPFYSYSGFGTPARAGYGLLQHKSRFGVRTGMIALDQGVESFFSHYSRVEQRELACVVSDMVLTCDPRVRQAQESPLETASR